MHSRIVKILIFFVLAGLAHGAYVQFAGSRYDKKTDYENPKHGRMVTLENYIYSSTHAPLLLVGSSLTSLLPIAAFRVPAATLGMPSGSRVVIDMLSEQPTLPPLILIEVNVILSDADDSLIKEVNALQKRLLRQYQQRFRPTFMLFTEYNNLIDIALSVVAKTRGSGRDASPPPSVSSSQDALTEERVQKMIKSYQRAPSPDYLNREVAHIKQCIDQLIKRGAYVVLVEMPMDPRLNATPNFVHVLRAMRAAFPAGQYQWITPRPAHVETIDGVHLAPRSAQETAEVIDQTIMSLGLYRKLGLLPALGDAGT